MDKANLEALLERVENATGQDRSIDLELKARIEQFGQWSETDIAYALSDVERTTGPKIYTGSIDAAVALAEGVAHQHGRKIICFFCAGGQLTPYNAEEGSPDYHPLAKIDNSVTAGWMAHVAFMKIGGSESYGPARYSHAPTAPLAILAAMLKALIAQEATCAS